MRESASLFFGRLQFIVCGVGFVAADANHVRRSSLARIAGINLPAKKRVVIALTYIYGIGHHCAEVICKQADVPDSRRVSALQEDETRKLREIIDRNYDVEGVLRRKTATNIRRLMDLGCLRGHRHRKKLPVRGQRTRTNAHTRKGKAQPIAGRKKATK